MNDRKAELGNLPVGKLLVKYSIPAVIGMTVDALYSFVDAIFIGQGVGPYALSALSITFPIQLVVIGIALAIGVGSASIISRALGAGEDKKAARATGNSFASLIISSAVVTALGLFFLHPLLQAFGAGVRVLPLAAQYMSISFMATIFYTLANVSGNVIRAEGNARVSMTGFVLGTVINIILDPILIFGFGWGIRGAAIATLVATIISSLFFIIYFISGKSLLKVRWKDIRLHFDILPEMCKIGASSFARLSGSSIIGLFVNNTIMYYGGPLYLAILTMVYRLQIIAWLPIYGIAQGLQPILGFNFGARNMERVKEAIKKGIMTTTLFAVFSFLVMMLFPEALLRIFSNNIDLCRQGVPIMRTMILMFPLAGVWTVGVVLYQALGKAGPAFIMNIVDKIFFIPFIIALPMILGINGIWLTYAAADFCTFVVIYLAVRAEIRRINKEMRLEVV